MGIQNIKVKKREYFGNGNFEEKKSESIRKWGTMKIMNNDLLQLNKNREKKL